MSLEVITIRVDKDRIENQFTLIMIELFIFKKIKRIKIVPKLCVTNYLCLLFHFGIKNTPVIIPRDHK